MNMQFTINPIKKVELKPIKVVKVISQEDVNINAISLKVNMLDRLKNSKPCNCGK